MLPLGFAAWHYGPGQREAKLDEASDAMARASTKWASDDLAGATKEYEDALKALPEDAVESRWFVQLAMAKIGMRNGKLPEANQDLAKLVEEISASKTGSKDLLGEARSALAQSQYYLTWLMRLEGLPQSEWEPEIDSARQNYRLLAEEAQARGDQAAALRHQEDLESSIRLARLELDELQGINLPKQCCCCSGKCKSKSKSSGKKPPQDSRGAGSGPPPDGSGH